MIDRLASHPDPYPAYARLRRRGVHRLPDGRWVVARASEVAAVLAHPAAAVGPAAGRRTAPPAVARGSAPHPTGDGNGEAAAVRAAMARFSDGPDHDRRRAISRRHIDAMEPDRLRRHAAELARDRLGDAREVDVMATVARSVPVAVLAGALGIADRDSAVAATRQLCLALAPPVGAAPVADTTAVATLRRLLEPVVGGHADDELVNSLAILFQAMDATAGLIGNAVVAADRHPIAGLDPLDLVAETARHDPPVQQTTRLAVADVPIAGHTIPAGDRIVVLLAAANRDEVRFPRADAFDPDRRTSAFTFGAGPRPCPGDAHALALAAGALDALTATPARVVDRTIGYERRANLRIPDRLIVRRFG